MPFAQQMFVAESQKLRMRQSIFGPTLCSARISRQWPRSMVSNAYHRSIKTPKKGVCSKCASCWASLAYIIPVPVPCKARHPCRLSCRTIASSLRSITFSSTFQIGSSSPMPWYSPPLQNEDRDHPTHLLGNGACVPNGGTMASKLVPCLTSPGVRCGRLRVFFPLHSSEPRFNVFHAYPRGAPTPSMAQQVNRSLQLAFNQLIVANGVRHPICRECCIVCNPLRIQLLPLVGLTLHCLLAGPGLRLRRLPMPTFQVSELLLYIPLC